MRRFSILEKSTPGFVAVGSHHTGGAASYAASACCDRCVCVRQNKLGDTPLHLAAWRGQAAIVALLVRHGADQQLLNGDQLRPRQLAQQPDCAALLRPRSAQTAADDYGRDSDSD